MNRFAALPVIVLLAFQAGAQMRNPRVPGGRTFVPPRLVNNAPIQPRAAPTRGPIPFPAERPWLRLDTRHFILFTSGSERGARALADDFERLTALLLRTSPSFRRPAFRTPVFVFTDRRDLQPYLNATRGGAAVDATGATVRHALGSTMLLDASAPGGDVTTPRHELVHDLLRHEDRPLPLWIEEGVAEYYSTAGRTITEHVSRVRGRSRIPLPDLLTMLPADPRASWPDFYAQSWAAVATLIRLDARAFFELVRDLEHGAGSADAIGRRYGMSVAQLSMAMRTAGAPAAPLHLHEQTVEAAVRPLDRGELLYQLAALLASVAGGDEEADRHFRAALDAAPRHGEAHVRYAEFLASRERHEEAAAVASHGLSFFPDDPRLYAVIGIASGSVQALECARRLLPDRRDLDFPLFAAYMQHGQRAEADALFPALVQTTRVNDVRRMLLRADIARADALAREGRVAEAAQVLRALAGKMPGRTRVQLEEQAAALERTP